MRNPWCCMSYQTATKSIAIFNIVMMSLALLCLSVSLVVIAMSYSNTQETETTVNVNSSNTQNGLEIFWNNSSEIKKDDDGQTWFSAKFVLAHTINQTMVVVILGIAYCTMYLVISVHLLWGAQEKNLYRCQVWFQVLLVNTILSLVLNPLVISVMVPQAHAGLWLSLVLQTAFYFYILWVVYAFICEIRSETLTQQEGRKEPFITKA